MNAFKRAKVVFLATFVVYGVLVAGHLGEFWPFSIYPMFSQGGQPWSRALVREVDPATLSNPESWDAVPAANLPGRPYPLLHSAADHTDMANFVSKTQTWDAARVEGLRSLFGSELEGRALLVMRARGRLTEADSVAVEFVPYVLLGAQEAVLNPALKR